MLIIFMHYKMNIRILINILLTVLMLFYGRSCNCYSDWNYKNECDIRTIYGCIANVTKHYGFNLQSPDIMTRFPILSKAQFTELCSDYILMRTCLQVNKPCDYRGKIYSKYGLALAKGLDFACQRDVHKEYDAVVSCFHEHKVKAADRDCQAMLLTEVQLLINDTKLKAQTSRVDVSVIIEVLCQKLIKSVDCTKQKLEVFCNTIVAHWYSKVLFEAIAPTLDKFQCHLQMPISNIIILFIVSFAGAVVVGVAVYICIQRYKSFVRSKMNFVLSYIPKANQRLRKLTKSVIHGSKTNQGSEAMENKAVADLAATSSPSPPDTITQQPSPNATAEPSQQAKPWWNWLW